MDPLSAIALTGSFCFGFQFIRNLHEQLALPEEAPEDWLDRYILDDVLDFDHDRARVLLFKQRLVRIKLVVLDETLRRGIVHQEIGRSPAALGEPSIAITSAAAKILRGPGTLDDFVIVPFMKIVSPGDRMRWISNRVPILSSKVIGGQSDMIYLDTLPISLGQPVLRTSNLVGVDMSCW